MASREIPERMTRRVSSVGEALSFAYFSLLASSMLALRAGFAVRASRVGQQRKVSRSPTGEWKPCTGPFSVSSRPAPRRFGLQRPQKRNQTLSSAGAAEFISFVNRQKKRNQRKTIPRRSSPTHHSFRHFPTRHPWLGRKTAGIHARRPSGVRCAWMRHGNQKRLDYRRAHTDAENRYPDPRTVCTMPSSPLGSSVLRRRRMCTSTVRSST